MYADKKSKQHVELIEVKPANQTLREKVGRSRHNQAAYVVNPQSGKRQANGANNEE